MICRVMLVSIMRGWFLGRDGMFRMAVVWVKEYGVSELEVIIVRSCHVA